MSEAHGPSPSYPGVPTRQNGAICCPVCVGTVSEIIPVRLDAVHLSGFTTAPYEGLHTIASLDVPHGCVSLKLRCQLEHLFEIAVWALPDGAQVVSRHFNGLTYEDARVMMEQGE